MESYPTNEDERQRIIIMVGRGRTDLAKQDEDDEEEGEEELEHEVDDEHGVVEAQLVVLEQVLQVLDAEPLLRGRECQLVAGLLVSGRSCPFLDSQASFGLSDYLDTGTAYPRCGLAIEF